MSGGLAACAENAVGCRGEEQKDRGLAGDSPPLPQDGVAGEVPGQQTYGQRDVQQHEVGIEAAPEREGRAQHGGHDHRRVREHHRHHEAEEHCMQRGVVGGAVATRRVGGPQHPGAGEPYVAGEQRRRHEARHATHPNRPAGDVVAREPHRLTEKPNARHAHAHRFDRNREHQAGGEHGHGGKKQPSCPG